MSLAYSIVISFVMLVSGHVTSSEPTTSSSHVQLQFTESARSAAYETSELFEPKEPSYNVDYFNVLGPLIVDVLPNPPEALFRNNEAHNHFCGAEERFEDYFNSVQELSQNFGSIQVFSDRSQQLQEVRDTLTSENYEASTGSADLFSISCFFHSLINLHAILKDTQLDDLLGPQREAYNLMTQKLEEEISLFSFFDLNICSDSRESSKDSYQKLLLMEKQIHASSRDVDSYLASNHKVFAPLVIESERVARLLEFIKHGFETRSDFHKKAGLRRRLVSRSNTTDIMSGSVSAQKIMEISRNLEKLRNVTQSAQRLLDTSSCVDLPIFDTWLCLLSFKYQDSGSASEKWSNLEVPEVKEIYQMLKDMHKKLEHLQAVYLWRISHDNLGPSPSAFVEPSETVVLDTSLGLTALGHSSPTPVPVLDSSLKVK